VFGSGLTANRNQRATLTTAPGSRCQKVGMGAEFRARCAITGRTPRRLSRAPRSTTRFGCRRACRFNASHGQKDAYSCGGSRRARPRLGQCSLSAEREMKLIFESRQAHRDFCDRCPESVWKRAPLARTIEAISSVGKTTPVSLFAPHDADEAAVSAGWRAGVPRDRSPLASPREPGESRYPRSRGSSHVQRGAVLHGVVTMCCDPGP